MFSSEQGAELEKIHSVGLVNSKTPSQTGSFQGQQVTVTPSLYAEGVNVRERQRPRPTDGFPGSPSSGHCTSIPVHSFYPLMPLDTHMVFYMEARRRQMRPLELNSHSRPPSTVAVSHQSSQWGLWEQSDLSKRYLRLNYATTGY